MTYLCPCNCHRVDPDDDVWCDHCAEQHPAPPPLVTDDGDPVKADRLRLGWDTRP